MHYVVENVATARFFRARRVIGELFRLNTASSGQSVWFGTYLQTSVKEGSAEEKAVAKAFGTNPIIYSYEVVGDFYDTILVNGIKYERVTYNNDVVSVNYYRYEPIEWIVLGEIDGYYKLLSKKILCDKEFCSYSDEPADHPWRVWKDSDIRSWLNSGAHKYGWYIDGFLGWAFNEDEQADMVARSVSSYDTDNRTEVWTSDKVTLLDLSELSQVPDSLKIAYATDMYSGETGDWWLRSDSDFRYESHKQACVSYDGDTWYNYATGVQGVRPVIWVKNTSQYLYTKNPLDISVIYQENNPEKITLNTAQKTLNIGDTVTLKATVSPTTAADKTVKWTSSNTKVATVDSKGKVKAIAKGTATITAKTVNGKTATCKVTVTQYKTITKITLNKTSLTLDQGASQTLKATISPTNVKDKTVKWSSSNKKVATVDSNGKVKAVAQGTATITAKTVNGKTATCKITVTKYHIITKFTLNTASLALNEGASQTLKATISPTNVKDKTLKWSSSNTKVASVDSKGKVKAVAKGTASITVKAANGKTATCKVTVKALSVQYRTHVQTFGWETKWAADGAMSGTQGLAKRLEGIYIRLANKGYSGDIQYRTHVQTYGWQGWKKNGQMAGTTGEAKRLEAIQIKLTGDLAQNYDIYYRTHVQTFGWSGWAKNGEMCGSAGYAKRLEGINIKLVKKGGKAPGSTADSFFENNSKIKINLKNSTVTYTYANKGKAYNLINVAGITTNPSTLWTTLSYSSTNMKVAQVVNGKNIKITGIGDADIKVTAKGLPTLIGYQPGTATIHVKVLAQQNITISGFGKYDSTNKRYNVTYTNQPMKLNASALGGAALTYYITDKNGKTVVSPIATIDKNTGTLKFTGKKAGIFYVTIKAAKKVLTKGGYAAATKTIQVNVTKATPVITGSTSTVRQVKDGTFNIGTSITLGGVMKYSSSNTSVLTVGANGVVTPVPWDSSPGQKEAVITVSSTATPVLNAAKPVTVKIVLKNAQQARWFMDAVKISQIPGGDYSHKGTQNFDVVGYNNNTIYAPFDCIIVAIYPGEKTGNTVVIESLKPVLYANGTVDYMSMCFAHKNNLNGLKVGNTYLQGQAFYETGTYGYVTGRQSHVTCIRGKYKGDMWTKNSYGNYCSPNAITPTSALFVPSTTPIINAKGLSFKRM